VETESADVFSPDRDALDNRCGAADVFLRQRLAYRWDACTTHMEEHLFQKKNSNREWSPRFTIAVPRAGNASRAEEEPERFEACMPCWPEQV
jgi:hypothetical protein